MRRVDGVAACGDDKRRDSVTELWPLPSWLFGGAPISRGTFGFGGRLSLGIFLAVLLLLLFADILPWLLKLMTSIN
uniref:Uncharacterized protein n=1 Tax=Romanomermis culicivorax TaxID=13658 RepID=A0A915JHC9_ROMCU